GGRGGELVRDGFGQLFRVVGGRRRRDEGPAPGGPGRRPRPGPPEAGTVRRPGQGSLVEQGPDRIESVGGDKTSSDGVPQALGNVYRKSPRDRDEIGGEQRPMSS